MIKRFPCPVNSLHTLHSFIAWTIFLVTWGVTCFFIVLGGTSHTRFTFANNSAGSGGDILYGGLVALGMPMYIKKNCLKSFKKFSNISQSSLSLISSDPSGVCFCNGTKQPDCLTVFYPMPHAIYTLVRLSTSLQWLWDRFLGQS